MRTETFPNLHYDKLWCISGDPFVDAGGYALKALSEIFKEKDIMDLIEYATHIYVDIWNAKLNSYFLNSEITQPAFSPSRKKEATLETFKHYLSGEGSVKGCCRILGMESNLYPSGRNDSVLTGSRAFANFHHSFEEGIMISVEAHIRYFFLPLATQLLCGGICVINSSCEQTSEYYVKNVVKTTLGNIAQNCSVGVLNNYSKSPSTALFRFVDTLLSEVSFSQVDVSQAVTLYLFSNFGANPGMDLYLLSSPVFSFYRETRKRDYLEDWNSFVIHYYRPPADYKNATYIEKQNIYSCLEKKQQVLIQYDDFQYWKNPVYDCLLNNNSLLTYILKWTKEHSFNTSLLNLYLQIIRRMKKETISKIDQIANFILDTTSDSDMHKVLTTLNSAKTAFLLRRFIIQQVAKNYKLGNKEPLLTVEEYLDYLFPETESWKDIRDILLINIYQKLHERNIHVSENTESEISDFEDDPSED